MTSYAPERRHAPDALSSADVHPLQSPPLFGYGRTIVGWSRAASSGWRLVFHYPRMSAFALSARLRPWPEWLAPTLRSLADLAVLQEGWDSYSAPRIEPSLIEAGARLLAWTMPDNAPPPSVVPTSRGGVAFEWHMRDIDLEVEIVTPARSHVYFMDHRSGREWEDDLTSKLAPLVECLVELTRRWQPR